MVETSIDTQLVRKVQQFQDNDSLMELANKHLPLCISVYQKYLPAMMSLGLSVEDIQADRLKIVWDACKSYNEAKNTKFSSWLGNHIRFQCLREMNKKNKSPKLVHIEDSQNLLKDKSTKSSPEYLDYIVDILNTLSDKRIKKIFELKYSEKELNFAQIGAVLNLSSFRVNQLHNIGIERIKNKLKKK